MTHSLNKYEFKTLLHLTLHSNSLLYSVFVGTSEHTFQLQDWLQSDLDIASSWHEAATQSKEMAINT